MKTIKKYALFQMLLCFLLVSIESNSQSKRALIKEYKHSLDRIMTMPSFNNDNRMDLYQSMDLLPRIVWGKLETKFITKKQCTINNASYLIVLNDYDNDGVADQFVLQTLDGKDVWKEFGFIYDLNKDGKIDYIVYNGGFELGKNNDFYYFFYHWIDSNFDGKIDALVYNVFVNSNDSLPDPQLILWVIDADKNGKPDSIDFIDIQNRKVNPLNALDGIWNFMDSFGSKTVNSNDDKYFKIMNEYMKALNE